MNTSHVSSNHVEDTHKHGSSLSEIDWETHKTNTSGCMLAEVDWGAHDSTFSPSLVHDGELTDFFTQGLWGGLPQRKFSTHLREYLKDSLDTGQTEDGFSNLKSIKEHRGSYSLSDLEYLGFIEWEPGEATWEP